jgi:hypothetical protein
VRTFLAYRRLASRLPHQYDAFVSLAIGAVRSRALRMSGLITVSAAIALGIVGRVALADNAACTFAESGYGYVKVVDRGEEWTYVLKSLGTKWRTAPDDYHSSGRLFCQDCAFAKTAARGEFYLSNQKPENSPFGDPSTAAERVQRRNELLGGIALRPNRLEVRGSREAASLDSLSGYAVLYRVILPNVSARNEPTAIKGSLLVVHLRDGCVEFDASIGGKLNADENDWSLLDSLLSEVTIKKSRSADAKFPVGGRLVARPRNPGEEPAYLYKLNPLKDQ